MNELVNLKEKAIKISKRRLHIGNGLKEFLKEWKLYTYNLDYEEKEILMYKECNIFGECVVYFVRPKSDEIFEINFDDWNNKRYDKAVVVSPLSLPNSIVKEILNNFLKIL